MALIANQLREPRRALRMAPAPIGAAPTGWHRGFVMAGVASIGLAAAVGMVLAQTVGWAVPLAAVPGLLVLWALAQRHYPHSRFGMANSATLLRGALAVGLWAPLVHGAPGGWAVMGVATVALALDGVDGWAARRQKLQSRFGARFDMEVDSILAATLALHAALGGVWAPLALVLGGARYGFVAAGWIWPWLKAPLPDALWRKAACVAQLASLIALQAPVLSGLPAQGLAAAAVSVLVVSFARDVAWLRRHRR